MLHEAREHAHAVVLHDLQRRRSASASSSRITGSLGRAVLVRDVEQLARARARTRAAATGTRCRARSRASPSRPSSPRRPGRARSPCAVRAPSKNTSLNSALPVICRSGRTSMPGWSIGHEQVREAVVARRLGIGAAHDEAPVGAVRERRPHLLAVDHPLVAVEHGAGLDVREVGAGVRLGEALAPQLLDRLDLREEPALLLVGAELDERRREQALAEERDPRRRVRLGVLLVEDDLLRERRRRGRRTPPATTCPTQRSAPSSRSHSIADVPARLVGRARPTEPSAANSPVRCSASQAAHLGAEGRLIGRVAEVHGGADAT